MWGIWFSFRAGSVWTFRGSTPSRVSHSLPAGEKKGSVRKVMPSMSRIAVAVPMWVMVTLFLKVDIVAVCEENEDE